MLADRDSLLVISAVAWVLLGGRIMGWGGVGGQTEGDESTWLCSGRPGYCCCRPSGLALRPFLAVFPGSHPARPRNSLTTRLAASSCWASPSLPIGQLLSQAVPPPPHLPGSEPDSSLQANGSGEGPLEESQRPTTLGQQTTPNKPNSLQKCLQQLGDIGRVMEDNYRPEQKLGDVQLQETGGSAGCGPRSPHLLTLTVHSGLPLGPHYGLG